MKPPHIPIKITITQNHWRVPSSENVFDGLIVGKPSEEERHQRIEKALRERADWKPSKEAMQLVEQLKSYIGCRVQIQFWDPIMLMLDEGPFPLEADCKDVALLQDGEFLQAYLVVDSIREILTPDGYSPLGYLISRDGIAGQLAPLSRVCEIWLA